MGFSAKLFSVAAAIFVSGCYTPPPVEYDERDDRYVSVKYDPDHYSETETTATAVAECRARGFADAVPSARRTATSAIPWDFVTFRCVY